MFQIWMVLALLGILGLLILGFRAWRRGLVRQGEIEKMRQAEAARLRRQEKRRRREAENALTPIDPQASRHQGRRPVIMVVDDSEMIRHNLRRTLEDHAYRVITAENGRRAWAELQECRPDLLITDIQMPQVNGFQLLRLIREDLVLTDLPVLLLTGRDEYDVPQGQEAGANGFIRKPYEDKDMIEQVHFLLQD